MDALHDDVTDVVSVQDFFSTPQLRPFLTSNDKTTWVCRSASRVSWARRGPTSRSTGSPTSSNRASRVATVSVHVTGPAATVADLTVAGEQDRLPIEIAIAVLVLAVLLVVYRNSSRCCCRW